MAQVIVAIGLAGLFDSGLVRDCETPGGSQFGGPFPRCVSTPTSSCHRYSASVSRTTEQTNHRRPAQMHANYIKIDSWRESDQSDLNL